MATPSILSHLLLILIFSGLASNLAMQGGAHAARIPEHSCHQLLHLRNKCDNQECSQECSKHPSGVGQCKATTCFCTYYCRDPPL